MASFKVAHISVRGQDMIVLPLDDTFGFQPMNRKLSAIQEIQAAAKAQGMMGRVVPVWADEGQIQFIAPEPWHPFFRTVTWSWVTENLNKELTL